MNFGFDPFAFSIALVVVWFTINESRRNNSVILSLRKAAYARSADVRENHSQLYDDLTIIIRNHGITLHSMTARLTFRAPNGRGTFRVGLKNRDNGLLEYNEFTKGMVANFGLKSYELAQDCRATLRQLQEPKAQNARLSIYSQGYLAYEFAIDGYGDGLKSKWNRFAASLNSRFQRRISEDDGQPPLIHAPEILPTLVTLKSSVMGFACSLRPIEPVEATNEQAGAR